MTLGAPPLPLWLGLSGLLPFWGLALAQASGLGFGWPAGTMANALALYGATILSFLGGIRWGVAMGDAGGRPRAYALSVLPQLAGWATLALPDPWRLAGLAVLILILGPLDRRLVRRGLAPPWFGDLRVVLSIGAGAALFLAALR